MIISILLLIIIDDKTEKPININEYEIRSLYKGLNFSKTIIVYGPKIIYNIDTEKIVEYDDQYEITDNEILIELKTYHKANIEDMNKCSKIFIIGNKNDMKYIYKYATINLNNI